MRVFPGRVEDGRIVPDGDISLREGAMVTVIADGPDESAPLSEEQEAELLDAIDEIERGEVITAADLLSRLKT